MPYKTAQPRQEDCNKTATEMAYDELIEYADQQSQQHRQTASAMANLIDSGKAYPSEIPKVIDKHRETARIQGEIAGALKQMKCDALCDQ